MIKNVCAVRMIEAGREPLPHEPATYSDVQYDRTANTMLAHMRRDGFAVCKHCSSTYMDESLINFSSLSDD